MIWQPEREIEIVAGTPPGGGLDRSARALLKALTANGLIEVPMGLSLRTILFEIGGGIPGGRAFKAAVAALAETRRALGERP